MNDAGRRYHGGPQRCAPVRTAGIVQQIDTFCGGQFALVSGNTQNDIEDRAQKHCSTSSVSPSARFTLTLRAFGASFLPKSGAEEKTGSLRWGWRVWDHRKKASGGRGI